MNLCNYCAVLTSDLFFSADYSLCSWLWASLYCMYSAGLSFPCPPFPQPSLQPGLAATSHKHACPRASEEVNAGDREKDV